MIGIKQLASLLASLIVFASSAFLQTGDDGNSAVALRAVPGGGTQLVANGPVPIEIRGLHTFDLTTSEGVPAPPAVLEGSVQEVRGVAATTNGPIRASFGSESLSIPPGSRILIQGLDGALALEPAEFSTVITATGLARSLLVQPPHGTRVSTSTGPLVGVPARHILIDGALVSGNYRDAGHFDSVQATLLPGGTASEPAILLVGGDPFPIETGTDLNFEDLVGVVAAISIGEEEIVLRLEGFANVTIQGESYGFDVSHEERIPLDGVVVNHAPTPDFVFRPRAPVPGERIEFIDRSTDDRFVHRWHWDFGDGATATGQHPYHAFASSGAYVVTLTVWDVQGASAETSRAVTVANTPPEISIDWTPRTPIQFEDVAFLANVHDNGPDIQTVHWTFSDGVELDGIYVHRAFAEPATYGLSAAATDADGTRAWANASIIVLNAPPIPSFVAVPENPMAGRPAQLRSTSTDPAGGTIVNTTWTIGGLTRPRYGEVVDLTFARDGMAPVRLTVTDDDGQSATLESRVNVANPPPLVRINYAPAYPNPGSPVTFIARITDDDLPSAANWAFSDGTARSGLSITHAFTTGGTHSVDLTVRDRDGASATASRIVRVNNPPVATIRASALVVNTGEIVTLTAEVLDADGNATTHAWTVDRVAAGSAPELALSWAEDGEREIDLVATDANGATSSAEATIVVLNRAPTLDPQIVSPVANVGRPVTLTSNAADSDGTVTSVEWFLPGESAPFKTGPTIDHTFATAGTVPLTVVATDDDGASQSAPLSVTVNAAPVFSAGTGVTPQRVLAGDPVSFNAAATDAEGDTITFLWNFGDDVQSSDAVTTHAYAAGSPGGRTFTAAVTATDALGAQSAMRFSIVVTTPPLVTTLTVDPALPRVGQEVAFAVGVPVGRTVGFIDWSFGDGTQLTTGAGETSALHTYSEPRTYDVQVVVHADHGSTDRHARSVRVTGAIDHVIRLFPRLPDQQCVQFDSPNVSVRVTNLLTHQTIDLTSGTYTWTRAADGCTISQAFPAGTWSLGDGLDLAVLVGPGLTTRALEFNAPGLLELVPLDLTSAGINVEDFAAHNSTAEPNLPGAPPRESGTTYRDPLEPVFASGTVRWADGTPAKQWLVTLTVTYRDPLGQAPQQTYATWEVQTDASGAFQTEVPRLLLEGGESPGIRAAFAPGQYTVLAQATDGFNQVSTGTAVFIEDPYGILAVLRGQGAPV